MFLKCQKCQNVFRIKYFDGKAMKFCPECGEKFSEENVVESGCDSGLTAENVPIVPEKMPTEYQNLPPQYCVPQNMVPQNMPPQYCMPQSMAPQKQCPMCGENILFVAKKCRFCGSMLDGSEKRDVCNRRLYVILAVIFGYWGGHSLYAKKYISFFLHWVLTTFWAISFIVSENTRYSPHRWGWFVAGCVFFAISEFFAWLEMLFDPNASERK